MLKEKISVGYTAPEPAIAAETGRTGRPVTATGTQVPA